MAIDYVSIQQLKALIDRKSGKVATKRPRFVKQDQVVIAVLQTSGVICLETFKDFPQMARFTLRDEGQLNDKYQSLGYKGGGENTPPPKAYRLLPPQIHLCSLEHDTNAINFV